MRTVLSVLVLSAIVCACSGSDGEDATPSAGTTAAETQDSSADSTDSTDSGTAPAAVGTDDEVDCAYLTDEANQTALIGLQLIPQMTSQSTIDSIKGTVDLRVDELLAYLDALRPLGGTEYEVFGDPADDIERYIEAANAAREILAVEGPIPQARLDAFVAMVGDVSTFIGGQASIGAALDEACN
jgi:hypothetical protein